MPNPLEPDSVIQTLSESVDPKVRESQKGREVEKPSEWTIYETKKAENIIQLRKSHNRESLEIEAIGKSRKSDN